MKIIFAADYVVPYFWLRSKVSTVRMYNVRCVYIHTPRVGRELGKGAVVVGTRGDEGLWMARATDIVSCT